MNKKNNGDYRYDSRTEQQFRKDIKSSHKKEALIAVRLCIYKYNKTKIWPTLIPNGVDISGKFIKNIKKVVSDADFKIGSELIEITRSDGKCEKYFHEKINKVKKSIENNASIVFVNGYDVKSEPDFIILDALDLEALLDDSKVHYMFGKPMYRYQIEWFDGEWRQLPKLTKEAQERYKDILDAVK